jgi:hypothetical protein
MKKFVKELRILVGFDLKTIAYMALLIYWGAMFSAPFSQ